jgi:hypothetical protein
MAARHLAAILSPIDKMKILSFNSFSASPFYFFYPRMPGMTPFLSISKHCRNKNKRDNLIKLVLICLAIPPLWLTKQ